MFRPAAVVLIAALTGSPGARAAPAPDVGECLGGAAVQEILAQGKARRLAEIRRGLGGDIVRADLCRSPAGLVYRVTLLDDSGRVRKVLLDATSGRLMYDGNGN